MTGRMSLMSLWSKHKCACVYVYAYRIDLWFSIVR